jgi:hypothetical protein
MGHHLILGLEILCLEANGHDTNRHLLRPRLALQNSRSLRFGRDDKSVWVLKGNCRPFGFAQGKSLIPLVRISFFTAAYHGRDRRRDFLGDAFVFQMLTDKATWFVKPQPNARYRTARS